MDKIKITGLRTPSKYKAQLQGNDALINLGWDTVKSYMSTSMEQGLVYTSTGIKDKALLRLQGANIYLYLIQFMINMREELYNLKLSPTLANLEIIRDKYNLDCVEESLTCLSKKYATDYFNIYKSLKTAYFDITPTPFIPQEPTLPGIEDWYLPCRGDISLVFTNLFKNNIGSFSASNYLTSTWVSAPGDALVVGFDYSNPEGTASNLLRSTPYLVRPGREFVSEDIYILGDSGPAMGYIYNIVDNLDGSFTYYEIANEVYETSLPYGASGIGFASSCGADAPGIGQCQTNYILDALTTAGETGKAAQYCNELSVVVIPN